MVFISHRKDDVARAVRIAHRACLAGFDFWLDIFDPALAGYPGVAEATPQEAQVVALIIEMALLYSTQVIAVYTPQTAGSQWVPYEYGRVKEQALHSPQAASWLHSDVTLFPEYLYLGERLHSEGAVDAWLKSERRRMGFNVPPTCSWTGEETRSLDDPDSRDPRR